MLKNIGLAVLVALASTQALATTANFYECKGAQVNLTYSTSGFASSTYVNLTMGKKNYVADKDTLETQNTVMGNVNTLTLKFIPDLEIKKASFIIPDINLETDLGTGQLSSAKFRSQLILTTIATPFIGGPYVGVVNKSKYIDLLCTASVVY